MVFGVCHSGKASQSSVQRFQVRTEQVFRGRIQGKTSDRILSRSYSVKDEVKLSINTDLEINRFPFRHPLLYERNACSGMPIEIIKVRDAVFAEKWPCHSAMKPGEAA